MTREVARRQAICSAVGAQVCRPSNFLGMPADIVKDPLPKAARGRSSPEEWLADFHRGNRATFQALYEDYFAAVDNAVGRILVGADKETVVHEVFYRILSNREVRLGFQGGSFVAWLSTLARNRAIDFHRRRQREQPMGADPKGHAEQAGGNFEARATARLLLTRFSETKLPEKWRKVFELRFVQVLDQHEAAKELGMSRTTLAYQEHQIRRLLRRFVLDSEDFRS